MRLSGLLTIETAQSSSATGPDSANGNATPSVTRSSWSLTARPPSSFSMARRNAPPHFVRGNSWSYRRARGIGSKLRMQSKSSASHRNPRTTQPRPTQLTTGQQHSTCRASVRTLYSYMVLLGCRSVVGSRCRGRRGANRRSSRRASRRRIRSLKHVTAPQCSQLHPRQPHTREQWRQRNHEMPRVRSYVELSLTTTASSTTNAATAGTALPARGHSSDHGEDDCRGPPHNALAAG